jgi:hypothetical protein
VVQLEAIEAEKKTRHASAADKLAHLMEKGTVLKSQLDAGLLSAPAIVDELQEKGHAHFADECEGLRRVQQQHAARARHAKLKHLNAERARLQAQEEALQKQMADHQYIVDKGLDYLVEVKMGHAPPMELILQNKSVNDAPHESNTKAVEDDVPMDVVLREASAIVAQGTANIDRLRATFAQEISPSEKTHHVESANYDGALGLASYHPSQYMARHLVLEIIYGIVDAVVEVQS